MNHMTDMYLGDEPWNEQDHPMIMCPHCLGDGCHLCDYEGEVFLDDFYEYDEDY